MKVKFLLSCLALALLPAATFATTLADWTFEDSVPTTAGPYDPEIGSGNATGSHVGSAVYSSPAGNGSSHSYSANTWVVGDYWQFAVSTLGAKNIVVSYDQISSGTGPGQMHFQYSTDGINFTNFGSTYSVIVNGTYPNGWSSSSGNTITISSYTNDLSSIAALNDVSVVYFRLVDASTTSANGGTVGTSGTDRVDNFAVTASTGTPPTISDISPLTITANAGSTVSLTVTLSAGDTPFTYFWYKETGSTTNLISIVTSDAPTNSLTLPDVLLADAANYQVIVSNASAPTAISDPVSVSVTDPAINTQPVSQSGLFGGAAQFPMSAGGTDLSYQWYFCADPYDDTFIGSVVTNGVQASGSIVSGADSDLLLISNLTAADPTNFVVVVTGDYGSVTSSVVSLTVVNTGPLAFWNFTDPNLNITNPEPYQGIGTASATNVETFQSPAFDANDPSTLISAWGTDNYPASGLNKQAGVQFNVSTVGAKNIVVSYDLKGSATASEYQRLQFTTNGTSWIDYPTSSTLGGFTSFQGPFVESLAGFPGVANNPDFGIRIVSEFESTASYNDTNDAVYVGVSAAYSTVGTLTYDMVTISGDAITDSNQPPTISSIPDQTMEDTVGTQVDFTVGDDSTPAGSLSVTAVSLDPNVNLLLDPQNNGGAVQLNINSSLENLTTNYVPILVTVTDGDGDVTSTWFTLAIAPANTPPVLTGLDDTNMLPTGTLVIPFTLTDDHTDPNTINPTVFSGNTTLIPNDAAHVLLGGTGTNRTLTITPVTNQLGTVPITVSASDGSLSSTQTIFLTVRPNTNVVLIDNFEYDGSGALDLLSDGFWQPHSGTTNQLQVVPGEITVDSVNNSEDVNAPLIGQPYLTNSTTVLYSKMTIQFITLPDATGAYFAHFEDNTPFGFLCRVWASTTNAAPGDYRIGIGNSTQSSATTAQLPQDLVLNSNYTIVSRLVMSNGFCTVWVNPDSESSPNATDTTTVTNLVNIYDYAFRESTISGGIVNVSNLVVGTSFNDVVGITSAPIVITNDLYNTNVYSGDTLTLSVLAASDAPLSYQWYYPNLNAPLNDGPSGYGSGLIAGSTNSSLTLTDVSTNQAGNYQVIISNSSEAVTSLVAHVTVNLRTPIVITNDLYNTNVYSGDTLTLSVLAASDAPLSYQWYYPNLNAPLNDGPSGYGSGLIAGSTNSSLTLTDVSTNQAGNYQVIISNSSEAVTSLVAHVTVNLRTPIVINIAYLRTLQNTNWFPSDTTNLYTITGIVTTFVNMTSSNASEFYIQDATAGIAVFVGGTNSIVPNAGDQVQVTGPMGQFNGLLAMNLNINNPSHSVTNLSSGNPLPVPTPFSFSLQTNISAMEALEGSRIVVSNIVLQAGEVAGFPAGGTIALTNLDGQIFNLFVNAAENDVVAQPVPEFASSIIGVLGQFTTLSPATNGYEIDITRYPDLTPSAPVVPMYIGFSGTNTVVSWSSVPSGFNLQTTTNLAVGDWQTVTQSPVTVNYQNIITNTMTNDAQFFRLMR